MRHGYEFPALRLGSFLEVDAGRADRIAELEQEDFSIGPLVQWQTTDNQVLMNSPGPNAAGETYEQLCANHEKVIAVSPTLDILKNHGYSDDSEGLSRAYDELTLYMVRGTRPAA